MMGKLYASSGIIPEGEIIDEMYSIGATKGGVRLSFSRKSQNVTDFLGNQVDFVSYGGTLKIKGKLAHVTPKTVAFLLQSMGGDEEGVFQMNKSNETTVCATFPTVTEKGEGETVLYAVCQSADEIDVTLGKCTEDGVDFTISTLCRKGSPKIYFREAGGSK